MAIDTPFGRLRAVLFDVDGTLYRALPLRAAIAAELLLLPFVRGPGAARRTWRVLRAYRGVHEELRALEAPRGDLADHHLRTAARRCGVEETVAERCVAAWMHERPLRYLRLCRRRGAVRLLRTLVERGVEVGVLSDYPAARKVAALGLGDLVGRVLCASDVEIGALKPAPRGFLAACAGWGVAAGEVLYVGDRADVDGVGAARAGMPAVVLGRAPAANGRAPDGVHYVRDLVALHRLLLSERSSG